MTRPAGSPALLTDHYELTMLQAALGNGTADRRSVFELFPRRLPQGRRYGVVAGVGRALDAIEAFRFDDEALATLDGRGRQPTLDWLAGYRFTGSVWGYAEGEMYFPYSPLLIVESTFAEAVLLETVLLSIYNHDSAIASAASRMTLAAGDRPCIEMGSRRTHEEAAVAAARAAYIAGFASSSNLAARHRYGVPTAGTSAHSFTLLHDTEADAFRCQVESLGRGTTLLVDTYDIAEAVQARRGGRRAGARRRPDRLRRPRRDRSAGAQAARRARRDRHPDRGHQRPRRVRHRRAGRGAGRQVRRRHRAGHRQRPPDLRLRLQARGARRTTPATWCRWPRRASTRSRVGGRKYALRRRDRRGVAEAEVVGIGSPPVDDGDDRPLLVDLLRDGEVVGRESLDAARAGTPTPATELPLEAQQMSRGEPVIETLHLGG